MKGFPKTLKTKDDYYNCLAMVAAGELAAADLLAKIESLEKQRYIRCAIVVATHLSCPKINQIDCHRMSRYNGISLKKGKVPGHLQFRHR